METHPPAAIDPSIKNEVGLADNQELFLPFAYICTSDSQVYLQEGQDVTLFQSLEDLIAQKGQHPPYSDLEISTLYEALEPITAKWIDDARSIFAPDYLVTLSSLPAFLRDAIGEGGRWHSSHHTQTSSDLLLFLEGFRARLEAYPKFPVFPSNNLPPLMAGGEPFVLPAINPSLPDSSQQIGSSVQGNPISATELSLAPTADPIGKVANAITQMRQSLIRFIGEWGGFGIFKKTVRQVQEILAADSVTVPPPVPPIVQAPTLPYLPLNPKKDSDRFVSCLIAAAHLGEPTYQSQQMGEMEVPLSTGRLAVKRASKPNHDSCYQVEIYQNVEGGEQQVFSSLHWDGASVSIVNILTDQQLEALRADLLPAFILYECGVFHQIELKEISKSNLALLINHAHTLVAEMHDERLQQVKQLQRTIGLRHTAAGMIRSDPFYPKRLQAALNRILPQYLQIIRPPLAQFAYWDSQMNFHNLKLSYLPYGITTVRGESPTSCPLNCLSERPLTGEFIFAAASLLGHIEQQVHQFQQQQTATREFWMQQAKTNPVLRAALIADHVLNMQNDGSLPSNPASPYQIQQDGTDLVVIDRNSRERLFAISYVDSSISVPLNPILGEYLQKAVKQFGLPLSIQTER